jgi:hypothetical protein
MDSKKRSTLPLVERIGHWSEHRRLWSLADVNDSESSSGKVPSCREAGAWNAGRDLPSSERQSLPSSHSAERNPRLLRSDTPESRC